MTDLDEYGQVAKLLSNIDGFFSADPVEALRAIKALVDAYGELLRDQPDALVRLIQSDTGIVLLRSSAATISSCLARNINDLANRT